MNMARHHLATIPLAVLAAAVLTIALPLAESDDSTQTMTIDQIRLGQPVLPGLPVMLWQGDSLMVSVAGDADSLEASELSERLVRLHEDEVFESHWREFLGAVAAAAKPLGGEPVMLRRFNLETLPNMLLARPELVQALVTGNAPEKAMPYGPTICIERTYGLLLKHCELRMPILGTCISEVIDGCDLSVQAWSCHTDKWIRCPPPGSTRDVKWL